MSLREIQLSDLSPAALAALCLLGKRAEKLRDQLEVGEDQTVDVELRICGAVHVGGTSYYDVQEHPKDRQLLALLLAALSPRTRKAAVEKVLTACKSFVAGGGDPTVGAEAEALAEDLVTSTSRTKHQPRRGSISGDLRLELDGGPGPLFAN